jgi:hypothetical protein
MGLKKLKSVWKGVTQAASGVGKVISGDWRGGFSDVYSGVSSLFSDKNAFGKMGGYDSSYYDKPNVSLMGYQVGTTAPGSSAKVGALGDTSMIPDWSRNQAVAMYYLDMINKITKQGSPRKGA